MNVEVENSVPESLEQLLSRHRKEKKDLQSKIQALKKTATKGDKKKKKEVSEEILKLETELQTKHTVEVESMSNGQVDVLCDLQVDVLATEVKSLNVSDGEDKTSPQTGRRTTKASKRRAKKAMLLKEQELRIAEQESQNIDGPRNVEMQAINSALKERGLMILEIPSDGDCMYNAVLAGLKSFTGGVSGVRKAAADILRRHQDEFLPFLSHPDTGEMLTESQYASYCDQVESTNAWGGHIELKAVSQGLECCIEVIQANSEPIIIGPQYKEKHHAIVTYHKHLYRLGEHYNSVQPYVAKEEEDEEEE